MNKLGFPNIFVIMSFMPIFSGAEEILMAFSENIPPYIFQSENKGIEIEVISLSLAYKGHTLKPHYLPLGRIPKAFINKSVTAAIGDMGIDLSSSGGFYASPAIIYSNVFISLKSSELSINKPSDLDKLTVISFHGAQRRYPQWLSKVDKEQRFYGTSNQISQVKLLNQSRYNLVLSDRHIFNYFAKELEKENYILLETKEHHFTESNPMDYRPVFNNAKIRDDFNAGLAKIKETGEFDRIYQKYIGNSKR